MPEEPSVRHRSRQEKAAARVAMDIRRRDQMLLFLALQHQFIGGILGTRRKGRKAPETGFCWGQTVLGSERIHPPSGGGEEGEERDGAGWLMGPAVDVAGAGCGKDAPSWFQSLARGRPDEAQWTASWVEMKPLGLTSGSWLSPSPGPWSAAALQSWVGGSIPARAHPEMKPSRGKLTGNVGSGCP